MMLHNTTDHVPSQQWPKIAVAALSCAIIALLAYLLFPWVALSPSPLTAAEHKDYTQAQSDLKANSDALAVTAGHAVSVLRKADEHLTQGHSEIRDDVEKLRAFLNEEPPSYEAPPVHTLSREEYDVALGQMAQITDTLDSLAHKLARQAQKVEKQMSESS